MYIYFVNADIKIVLYVVALIYFLLIFPVFLKFGVCFSDTSKKLFIDIQLFKIIVFSGYFEVYKNCILFKTAKKTKKIKFEDVLSIKAKAKPFNDYHIINFTSLIETGSFNNYVLPSTFSFIGTFLYNFILWFYSNKKPYLKIKNNFNVYFEDKFNVFIEFNVVFNLIMVIISLIKIVTEKIRYAFSK